MVSAMRSSPALSASTRRPPTLNRTTVWPGGGAGTAHPSPFDRERDSARIAHGDAERRGAGHRALRPGLSEIVQHDAACAVIDLDPAVRRELEYQRNLPPRRRRCCPPGRLRGRGLRRIPALLRGAGSPRQPNPRPWASSARRQLPARSRRTFPAGAARTRSRTLQCRRQRETAARHPRPRAIRLGRAPATFPCATSEPGSAAQGGPSSYRRCRGSRARRCRAAPRNAAGARARRPGRRARHNRCISSASTTRVSRLSRSATCCSREAVGLALPPEPRARIRGQLGDLCVRPGSLRGPLRLEQGGRLGRRREILLEPLRVDRGLPVVAQCALDPVAEPQRGRRSGRLRGIALQERAGLQVVPDSCSSSAIWNNASCWSAL